MIPFGAPGSGKSTVLNGLAGIPGHFKNTQTTASGQTQEIKSFEGPAFGIRSNPVIKIYDAPGVGDINLPLSQIVADIKVSIGSNNIDASLFVIKAQDYRMDLQQTIAIKVISKFFKNFDSRHVFLIITHADVETPTDDFIAGKLAAYKQYGQVEIPRENVIVYSNNPEQLKELIPKISHGNMQFLEPEQLMKAADQVFKELPGDFAKQDKEQGTQNLEMFKMMMEMMKEQNESMRQMMISTNAQVAQLASASASMPSGDSGFCSIF